ncbi:MAG: PDZ domain-containing protein [Bacteroidales bacterium]|nr:PDZ domain-containing protein [Bacteroidales bacterium]
MKRGDFATVESIYYQSEAYKNGLQLGDTIIKINNRDIKDITNSEFYDIQKNKNEIKLTITRYNEVLNVSFIPKELL